LCERPGWARPWRLCDSLPRRVRKDAQARPTNEGIALPASIDEDDTSIAQDFDVPSNARLAPGRYYMRVVAVNKLGVTATALRPFTIVSRS
jgi:hypothetical protein